MILRSYHTNIQLYWNQILCYNLTKSNSLSLKGNFLSGICELFIPVNQPFIPRQSNQIDKKNNIYSLPIHKQTPFIDEQKIKEFMF